MKHFIDFEFMEDGRLIEPLSIGIVSDDGREFYAEFADSDRSRANEFVRTHVIPKLGKLSEALPTEEIRRRILDFVNGDEKPEFWGYYADYDWVCFSQIFGRMVNLPRHFPMYCRDIKQFADDLGNPKLPPEGKNEHHALHDARWNAKAYRFLVALKETRADPERWKDLVRRILCKPKGNAGGIGLRLDAEAVDALYKLVNP
jgi:hypothetical protein